MYIAIRNTDPVAIMCVVRVCLEKSGGVERGAGGGEGEGGQSRPGQVEGPGGVQGRDGGVLVVVPALPSAMQAGGICAARIIALITALTYIIIITYEA